MRRVRKLVALLLSLAMVLAMSGVAMATSGPATLSGGEVGGFTTKDTPVAQGKSVNIQKEIKVYNPDEDSVYAPAITYEYVITEASGYELVTVTDDGANDHDSGASVTTTVLPGIVTGVVLTGTETGKIVLTNADTLDAAAGGASNYKNLTVDFSTVVFSGPGVYRYKITENVTYTNTGVTDGGISNIRYLDVYVMRSTTFDASHDGTTGHEFVEGDWSIYGYVCISPESIANTNAGGTTPVDKDTAKTNGFVNDGTNSSDEYYTYNFTVSKDLVGDDGMNGHLFPITVSFANGPTGSFRLMTETDGSKSSISDTAVSNYAGALTGFGNAGDPKVADGGYIKYIGIPNSTVVTVTETNDVVGTTYKATVKEDTTTDDGSALVAVAFTSSNGELSTDSKTSSISNGKTATRTAATGGTVDTIAKNVQIEFTNTLETISPTGLMFRYGPYVLILLCGALLLFLGVKFMRRNKEEN